VLPKEDLDLACAGQPTATQVAASGNAWPDSWRNPQLSCDIVMKGGITSGVVYPEAVVRLAERYRFCGIGGTSAGAIAAVALAAAEYGRARDGFMKLAALPAMLAATVEGEPFIQSLFQPEPETRPLFKTALAFQRGTLRGIGASLTQFWRFPAASLVLALAAFIAGATGTARWSIVILVVALVPWILVLGVMRDLVRAFDALAGNNFGLCRLGPRTTEPRALTCWLHDVIQDLADRGSAAQPMTFADLWGVPPLTGKETEGELKERQARVELLSWNTREREIDLQIVATNLTQGRPIRLPLMRDRWVNDYSDGGLLFDYEEWLRFFPRAVVDHMVSQQRALDADEKAVTHEQAPGRQLVGFTFSAELPIVVAARMSLSFPVLISAVPLWQIQYRKGHLPRLRRMVFSDGGISSNFPVQFFDSPLPTRPTFAINLAGFEDDEHPDLDDPAQCVRPPAETTGRAVESWKQPESMIGFFLAIKDAMQNWRDNAQARMPGFRERVIHIKLAGGEGGLNLAMDEAKVRRLVERGRYAGHELVKLFSGDEESPEQTDHWNDHRYARFRTYMASTERYMEDLRRGYCKDADAASMPYAERIVLGGEQAPYKLTEAQLSAAQDMLKKHLELTHELEVWLDQGAPRPKSILRNMPLL